MIPSLAGDHLPVGRHRCTRDELDAFFSTDAARRSLLEEFDHATDALQAIVGTVCAAWVGGSLVSSKIDPQDIDVVYVVEDTLIDEARAANPLNERRLQAFANGVGLKNAGLRVDSYLLTWRPNPEPVARDNSDISYQKFRGYWDDFWQRTRSGEDPRVRADALPRRGYLEVVIDGFT